MISFKIGDRVVLNELGEELYPSKAEATLIVDRVYGGGKFYRLKHEGVGYSVAGYQINRAGERKLKYQIHYAQLDPWGNRQQTIGELEVSSPEYAINGLIKLGLLPNRPGNYCAEAIDGGEGRIAILNYARTLTHYILIPLDETTGGEEGESK
jgi:hypothetical protein